MVSTDSVPCEEDTQSHVFGCGRQSRLRVLSVWVVLSCLSVVYRIASFCVNKCHINGVALMMVAVRWLDFFWVCVFMCWAPQAVTQAYFCPSGRQDWPYSTLLNTHSASPPTVLSSLFSVIYFLCYTPSVTLFLDFFFSFNLHLEFVVYSIYLWFKI